jgi:23S rRNA-/tRNA-specific pseudouridylate synthase
VFCIDYDILNLQNIIKSNYLQLLAGMKRVQDDEQSSDAKKSQHALISVIYRDQDLVIIEKPPNMYLDNTVGTIIN